MHFTVARVRALILAAGVLLVVGLAAFLAVGKWKSDLIRRELPQRLGMNVVQEANGVTYTEAHGGHILFKIHASRAEQLKNDHALLHNVQIEFFAKNGRTIDSISGTDFEYNQKTGIGTAQGPVKITLQRPQKGPAKAVKGEDKLPEIPASAGTIHVEASGVTFNQNTGVLTTAKKVDFSMARGSGTAIGASYDSQQGFLVLDRAVELTTTHASQKVLVHAVHAEFDRDAQLCHLVNATADYQGGKATAGKAKILFRGDGSAQRLDATDGFTLASATGSTVTAPEGTLLFGRRNVPSSGKLGGGVKLSSTSADRQLHGTAPDADLQFSPRGDLRQVRMIQGVELRTRSSSGSGAQALQVSRTWHSQTAVVDFRSAHGSVQPAVLHGSGGVVVNMQTRRGNSAPVPGRLAADEVTGTFGPGSELTAINGTGHATLKETTADGALQTATGDRIEARFAPASGASGSPGKNQGTSNEIQSAILDGHVRLEQKPASKSAAQSQPPLQATAGRAQYQADGQWFHLTGNPQVQDGGLNLTADKIDVSQHSQQGFAHGNVKATWMAAADGPTGGRTAGQAPVTFGGDAPAHIVADEAQFNQASGQAVFRGHARLWQQANSIAAPVIVLNRDKQTLVARSSSHAEPVQAVLLSTGELLTPPQHNAHRASTDAGAPSVIRVRGGTFTYSDSEHQAVMTAGSLGSVTAEAGGASCTAQRVVLQLKARGTSNSSTAEVERVTASGNVVISSQGRRGAGAELVYSSLTGEYALTGTPSAPPQLIDPGHGTVTGSALIFNSRNDSVSIEGRGRETRTETTAPR